MKHVALIALALVCVDCTPAQQQTAKTIAEDTKDVTGIACTVNSIVIQDPTIGKICTSVEEITAIFQDSQNSSSVKKTQIPATTHELAASIYARRVMKSSTP